MEKRISLRTWVNNFTSGKYAAKDLNTQCEAGWYDWFCNDSALANKTQNLGKKVIQIMASKKIDPDETYVFFKNNFPMQGRLYDDFRICDINTEEVLFTVTPELGYANRKGISEVWGKESDFKGALVSGSWKDVLKFFLG